MFFICISFVNHCNVTIDGYDNCFGQTFYIKAFERLNEKAPPTFLISVYLKRNGKDIKKIMIKVPINMV